MTLEEARVNVGRTVVYWPIPTEPPSLEVGVITSVNDTFVFVRYGADVGSKAAMPDDLQLEFP